MILASRISPLPTRRTRPCPLRIYYFRSKTDVRRREDPREIHARVKAQRNDADRPGPRRVVARWNRANRRNGVGTEGWREGERRRDTHAGGTTHDGPVICWTPHGHVVFHGHEVHSIVHFLALSRGVSYLRLARATLWFEAIARDSNRRGHPAT